MDRKPAARSLTGSAAWIQEALLPASSLGGELHNICFLLHDAGFPSEASVDSRGAAVWPDLAWDAKPRAQRGGGARGSPGAAMRGSRTSGWTARALVDPGPGYA